MVYYSKHSCVWLTLLTWRLPTMLNTMDFTGRRTRTESMRALLWNTHGTLLNSSQTGCYSSFRDTQIIMRMPISLIRLSVHMRKALFCLIAIMFVSFLHHNQIYLWSVSTLMPKLLWRINKFLRIWLLRLTRRWDHLYTRTQSKLLWSPSYSVSSTCDILIDKFIR